MIERVTVNHGYVTRTLTKPDGTPLQAGELQEGDTVEYDWKTGIIVDVRSARRCTYPLCSCAVEFPEGYKPEAAECPRM
jgi:hypothetical protein